MTDAEFRRRAHALIDSIGFAESVRAIGAEGVALLAAGPESSRGESLPMPWRMGSKAGESPSCIYLAPPEMPGSVFVKRCPTQDDAEREVLEHNRARES